MPGPSTIGAPTQRTSRGVVTIFAVEASSTTIVEWAAVSRQARRQSLRIWPGAPQLTMKRLRPELISKASVPAWAWPLAAIGGGRPTSATTTVRPASSRW